MEDVCKKMKFKADLAFTSPPYGLKGEILTTKSTGARTKAQVHNQYDSTEDSFTENQYLAWLTSLRIASHITFWNVPAKQYERAFGVEPAQATGQIIWKKPASVPFPRNGIIYFHEYIWMFGDPKRVLTPMNSVLEAHVQYNSKHPAPFPPELPAKAIQCCTEPGQVVFDPFGGSGTTAAVAKAFGRKFLTCDISPEYCEWMAERITNTKKL